MPENTRRKLLTGAVAAVAAAGTAKAQTKPQKRVIRSGPKPAKPPLFSPAVSFGDLLFLSGIGYRKEGDIKVHTAGVLDQIKSQLEAAGSSMEKVLKCTVFLADMKDFAAMNEVFQGRFGDDPPVRTTVAVSAIPNNSLVEIDVIAHL